MKHTGGRCAWSLWVVSDEGRDIALAAAPNAAEAVAVAGETHSVTVEAIRVGVADEGCVRIVRRFSTAPLPRPTDALGKRMLESAAAVAGVSFQVALSSNSPLAVAARWGAWVAMRERGISASEAGRQLGGRDHSTVMNALDQTPKKLAAGDHVLKASIEAARAVGC